MNLDLARHIARVAFRSSRDLGELVPFLNEQLKSEEYTAYSKLIASVIASIQIDLINKLTSDFPILEKEFEENIAKYGRYL